MDLQTAAFHSGHDRPLLIAIDQEGGSINSLNADEITQFPSAMGLAASGQPDLAGEVALATAKELRCLGFNWILGPVLDVLPTTKVQALGVRTFGDDPSAVESYGAHMIEGYRNGGLATGAKHFPGYGDTSFPDGSPDNVPCISHTAAQLHQNQLVPFREAIQHHVDAILVGGCAMTGIGKETIPHACLSEKVVTQLLRHELDFKGVVVSECLAMEALCENIGVAQGAVMSILAGCDLTMVCQTYQTQLDALSGLKLGVQTGHIPIELVHAALIRIRSLKDRLTSWDQALHPSGIPTLLELHEPHRELSLKAYNQSVSLIRDDQRNIPALAKMPGGSDILLLTPLIELFPSTLTKRHRGSSHLLKEPMTGQLSAGEDIFQGFGLSLANARKGVLTHTSYSSNGLRPSHEELISRAAAVIMVTADATRNSYQYGVTKHLNMLCKSQQDINGRQKPLLVIAVSSPCDFLTDTDIGTYICLYDFTSPALDVLVGLLAGNALPTGIPPLASVRQKKTPDGNMQPRSRSKSQLWLVEKYDSDRDNTALQRLLEEIPELRNYKGLSSKIFEIHNEVVEANHFVVKNSSIRTLQGFCATYYIKSLSRVYIAACMVNPHRRRMGIGESMCSHAIKWLCENNAPAQIQWCCSFPAFFSGFGIGQEEDFVRVNAWMNQRYANSFLVSEYKAVGVTHDFFSGWTSTATQSHTYSMELNLSTWLSPLDNDSFGFAFEVVEDPSDPWLDDLNHFLEFEDVVQNAINPGPGSHSLETMASAPILLIRQIYNLSASDQPESLVLIAREHKSVAIVAAVIVHFKNSLLSRLFPFRNRQHDCWAGALVVASHLHRDYSVSLTQRLLSFAATTVQRMNCELMVTEGLNSEQMLALSAIGFQEENKWIGAVYERA